MIDTENQVWKFSQFNLERGEEGSWNEKDGNELAKLGGGDSS